MFNPMVWSGAVESELHPILLDDGTLCKLGPVQQIIENMYITSCPAEGRGKGSLLQPIKEIDMSLGFAATD